MKKTILVSADRGETRVAVLESKTKGGKRNVAELYIERRGRRSIVGNIYKGVVDNVLPGMEAAFVDIGLERNGFLHVDEIVLPGGEAAPRRGRGKGRRINELIKPGQEIIVQVVKDPLKTKGARLSMQLSIAGRYLVYVPQGEGVGVSRRLPDKERDRLRKQSKDLDLQGGGAIIRTAASGAKRDDFERELKYLFKLHELLQKRAKEATAPAMVFQEADLSVRVVRDIFSAQFERAVIDVNSGSFTGRGKQARLEDTITKTNLESAEEVVRQLRLRDIGGIIVIDFIDMARARNRNAVLDVLRKALDEDRTKTFVVEISPLGLVEMTRQNVTDGAREIMTKACPTCGGEGVVKSEETIAIEAERRLRELVAEAGADAPEAYLVRMNPKVTAYFTGDGAYGLKALERDTGRFFHFTGSEGLPLDHFTVLQEGTRAA